MLWLMYLSTYVFIFKWVCVVVFAVNWCLFIYTLTSSLSIYARVAQIPLDFRYSLIGEWLPCLCVTGLLR